MDDSQVLKILKQIKNRLTLITAILLISFLFFVFLIFHEYFYWMIADWRNIKSNDTSQEESYKLSPLDKFNADTEQYKALFLAKNWQELLTFSDKNLVLDAEDPNALVNKAVALYQLEKYEDAQKYFLQAKDNAPSSTFMIDPYLEQIKQKLQKK